MPVVLIHQNPQLMDDCCDLINMEWPRSKTARMRSLQMSCDALPTCLAMTVENKVVGHSKISAINGIPHACFVESVVIHPQYRGKGLGRLLMNETEKFAVSLGMDSVYLSTIDQQEFYRKLGYIECGPVSVFGFSGSKGHQRNYQKENVDVDDLQKKISSALPPRHKISGSCVLPPPPPPPPTPAFPHPRLPENIESSNTIFDKYNIRRKTYFRKEIFVIKTPRVIED